MKEIPDGEIRWGIFHLLEDEKERHAELKKCIDPLLSFINPQLFTKYHKKEQSKEISNESFDEEIRSKLGMSAEDAFSIANKVGADGEIQASDNLDIFQDPMVMKNG